MVVRSVHGPRPTRLVRSRLSVGQESNPEILVPINPLTWTQVASIAPNGLCKGIFDTTLPGRPLVVVCGTSQEVFPNAGHLVLAHSIDGTTWTRRRVNEGLGFRSGSTGASYGRVLVERIAGRLSVPTGHNRINGAAPQARMLETNDLATFVAFGGDFGPSGGAVDCDVFSLLIAGTLYLIRVDNGAGLQTAVWRNDGSGWAQLGVNQAYSGAGTAAFVQVAYDEVYVYVTDAGAGVNRLARLVPSTATWETVWNATPDLTCAGYWPEYGHLYLGAANGALYRYTARPAAGTPGTAVFAGLTDFIKAFWIEPVSRNLYLLGLVASGNKRIYKYDGEGTVLTTLGEFATGGIAQDNWAIAYHRATQRLYLANSFDASTVRVYQSNALP